MVGRAVVHHVPWRPGVLFGVDGGDVDSKGIRAVEAFAAMLAADTFEFPRGCCGRRAASDVAHVLLQAAFREASFAMRAHRIPGALPRGHFLS